ncbi:MAG: bacterial Ig-like domain-containing protein, partial [Clostridia bacterium]|nr:bacterial Ig-like domain-containing protein [Clostridia bacterium]
MKKSKKLMLASAAALVALTATSLTACGDLADDVHYHSGTAYEHDDSQHWNVCDEDGEKVSGTEAAHEITELNVKTMPLKTEYLAGETFDATGLELEGVCVCGTLAVPIDEVVFDKTVLSAEDTEVTVSYNGLTATIRVTVTKDTRAISTPTIEGWTYGETANEPSCETEGVSFEYATSISAEEWSAEKPVNAGTYFVRAYIAEDDIYEGAVSVAAKFVIEKAKIAIPQKGEASYVYSGEEITFAKEGEGYTVSGNKGTNAGNYTVTFTLIDNENTEWADEFDGEYTYTIEKAKIAVP